jgi:hypothetical protein
MRPLLRHRLLPLRIPQLLLRALLLLRATLLLRLRLLLRTLVLLHRRLRTPLLLLRLRAQASKLHSHDARCALWVRRASQRIVLQSGVIAKRRTGKQKSHELRFVAFLFCDDFLQRRSGCVEMRVENAHLCKTH